MASRGDVHALVAGVDLYLPGPVPEEAYPSLRGAAADAREVALYLTRELEVPEGNVRLLTSTHDGGGRPAEPPEGRPDYGNLVAALADIAEVARPGDQVLVYYGGHGGRLPTLLPELKGEKGLDECLVPYDAGAGGRMLRDVEIAVLAAGLAERGLDVTLALDCCHAGGALKAPGHAAVRGVSFVDRAARPAGSAVGSSEELAAAWRRAAGRTAAGAVLLAACRPGERALEVLLQGRSRGIFTWALLDALRRLGPGVSYRRLHERILARVHSLFEIQTPMLDGSSERRVLGIEPRNTLSAVTVLKVERGSVLVGAGAPQGVGTGAWFAIHPLADGELARENRVALAEVTEAGAVSSRARVATVLRDGVAIEEGAPAVLIAAGGVRVRRAVALLEGAASARLEEVVQRLAEVGDAGFVEMALPGRPADFLVAENAGGTVEILDAAGEPLVALPARTRPAAVVAALEHLARYRNVQELENKDPHSDLHDKLAVCLERLPGPEPFPTLPPAVRPGDWVRLSIENRSVQELNIAVLNLQADWSIRQAYPNAAFLPLDSGAVECVPFEVHWPFRQPRGRDLFKIFAVSGPVDCHWLELPALGEPPLPPPGHRGSLPSGSLADLFATLTGEPPNVRALVPERQPQHFWTVVDLPIEVSR